MLSALRLSQSPSADGSETSKRAGKWQELQCVCDNDRHQVQLVTDETFPLGAQEGSGQAGKVLADRWPGPQDPAETAVGRAGAAAPLAAATGQRPAGASPGRLIALLITFPFEFPQVFSRRCILMRKEISVMSMTEEIPNQRKR